MTATQSGRWLTALLLTTLVLAALLSSSFSFAGTKRTSFEGAFVGDSQATVSVEVIKRPGGMRARFTARQFQVTCEGEAERRRVNFGPVGARFVGPKVFETRVRRVPDSLFKVQGRLLAHGRVKGFIFYYDEPVALPGEDQSDCRTDGLIRWRAAAAG